MSALKNAEQSLSAVSGKINALQGRLEDLLFRAQRIANAAKNGMPPPDNMFQYDLQRFRSEVRSFSGEFAGLPLELAKLELRAHFEEDAIRHARGVMRLADKVTRDLRTIHDQSLMAHEQIRQAQHKIEAWYMAQEIDQMVQKAAGLPSVANKILLRVGTQQQAQGPSAEA